MRFQDRARRTLTAAAGLFSCVALVMAVLGMAAFVLSDLGARGVSAQQPFSIVTHGNGAEEIVCDQSVAVNITSATTTALVALTAGQTIYVCGASLHLVGNATAVTATFEYGTGAACSTPTVLTGPYTGATASTQTTAVNIGANVGYAFKTAASNALCIVSLGTAGLNGVVTFAKF